MTASSAFLERAARALREEGIDHRAVVLFPSKRARLFFLRQWQRLAPPGAHTPRCYVWTEFLESHTPWLTAPRETLLLSLFETYKSVSRQENLSFTHFAGWGQVLLDDIEEIDFSMADADRLFRTAYDWQQIKAEFSADEEALAVLEKFWTSVYQARHIKDHFLRFWRQMPELYGLFRRRLTEAGYAYEGMIARHTAEHAAAVFKALPPLVAFVGFDLLRPAEQAVWRFFQQHTETRFFWNIPKAYLDLERLFMTGSRRMADILQKFPPALPSPSEAAPHPTLTVHQVPSRAYQFHALTTHLAEHHADEATAVIVPADDMVERLVKEWPATLPVNITAGLPLPYTPAPAFLMLLRRLRAAEGPPGMITVKLLRRLRAHPYFAPLFEKTPAVDSEGYYQPHQVLPPLLQQLRAAEQAEDFHDVFQQLLETAYAAAPRGSLEREALLVMARADASIQEVLDSPAPPDEHLAILEALIQNGRLPLEGHPLEGVQVMGVYESRGLSFSRVHFLDFTEKFWPPAPPPSLIPFPIRKAFGMPYFHHRILGYYLHFFQLASGADEVHVYVPQRDLTQELEPSRLIRLWPGEVQHHAWLTDWAVKDHTPASLTLGVTPADFQQTFRMLTGPRGLAPSALNKLRNCPRRFLLSVVRKIKEPEMPAALGMDARIFGGALHHAMETLYRPAVGRPVHAHAHALLKDRKTIHAQIEQSILAHAPGMGTTKDNPYLALMAEGIKHYVHRIVEADARSEPGWHLKALEEEITGALEIHPDTPIHFRGIIDRVLIHPERGQVRIEDYKTGRVSEKDLHVNEPETLFSGKSADHYDVYFQQALYGWLYARKHALSVVPHVWVLRSQDRQAVPLKIGGGLLHFHPEDAAFGRWEEALQQWLTPFWLALHTEDPTVFDPTPSPQRCKYCPFQVLCQAT